MSAVLAVLCMDAIGAVSPTVVDVPVGTHTQRFLYLRPAAPVANLVVVPGGDGRFGIADDGTMQTTGALCSPPGRNRQAYADHGFAVALVDADSTGAVYNFDNVREVIRYMQARDNLPTWLIGGSASTIPVAGFSVNLPPESPVGVILFSPQRIDTALAAAIKRPIQLVYNPSDPLQSGALVFPDLTSAMAKEQVLLQGGSNEGCGFHLFNGLDAEFVATTTSFIDRYNGSFAPSVVLAVEYHHAIFDHYFLTPVADEIAALDAKVPPFQDWSRTGFSFNVYANAGAPASSVAVCRFFNDSFAPKSSHFFAPKGSVCEQTIAGFPDWKLENDKLFNTQMPDVAGNCPAGTIPLYRLYNSGRTGAPNHRFLTSLAERQRMLDLGHVAEGPGGVGMCVPGP